ncbi:MAG: efflux RND transporter periplasmic adaptor subunit, partial [Acetobacteraceae bacterium]
MSRARNLLLAGLVAAAAIVGGVFLARGPAPRAAAPPARAGSVPVTVVRATRRDVPVYLEGLGQVEPLRTVTVKSRVTGELVQTPFTEGAEVKAGAVLAIIDPRPYQAVFDEAEAQRAEDQAQLTNAESDLARYSTLAAKDFASRQQLDTQRALVRRFTATLRADAAAIEAARLNLEFTRITAPISGRVGLRQVDPGNLIQANAPAGIVTVTQMRPIAVLFTLPQADVGAVRAAHAKGSLSVLALSENGEQVFDRGVLSTMDNAIDPTAGTIRLKALFPNQTETLWPGAFVNARLLLQTLPGALTLPVRAVQRGPDGLYDYLVRPDQ